MPDTPTIWTRVTIRVTAEAADAAGEILRRAGAAGWESPAPDTVAGYLRPGAGARVERIRAEVAGLRAFGLNPGPAEVTTEEVPERAWAEVWKSYFRPTRVGPFVVSPTWEEVYLQPGEVLLRLDPGMAFGSGAHATTRLCLRALADELPAGGRVLDVGTGSGILAIGAALLGASRVVALDNDPDVLPIARENAELNRVSERIEIREGTIADCRLQIADCRPAGGNLQSAICNLQSPFDVILANIAPDPVIDAAPAALELLAPGGAFIGAGIPLGRMLDVEAGLTAAGMRIDRVLQEEEWIAIVAGADEGA